MNKHYPEYHDYLRIGKLAESLDAEELADFEELMNSDDSFRNSFLKLEQEFSSGDLELLSRYKHDDEWQDVPKYFKPISPVRQFPWVRIAAAVVIVLGIGSLVFIRNNKGKEPIAIDDLKTELKLASGKVIDLSDSKGSINTGSATINNTGNSLTYRISAEENAGMNTLTVASGKDYHITLADGTQIWLNSTTKLDFPFAFSGKEREININGEAYLEVAKNPAQPFIVHLPESDVEVLGTAFNVNSYDSGVNKVSLVNGSVSFKASAGEIKLQPGKQGVYTRNGGIHEEAFDNLRTLSWRKGIFYFQLSPLTDIAKVISRWYNVKVIIDNNRNKDKRVVGAVDKNKPLDFFLNDLKEVSGIKSYYDKDGVLHFK